METEGEDESIPPSSYLGCVNTYTIVPDDPDSPIQQRKQPNKVCLAQTTTSVVCHTHQSLSVQMTTMKVYTFMRQNTTYTHCYRVMSCLILS